MRDEDKNALYMILERNGRRQIEEVLDKFREIHRDSVDLDKDLDEYLNQERSWR